MLLNFLGKMTQTRPGKRRAPLLALALCLPLATAACVSSTEPILSDARAILGERGQLHIFSAPKDGARNVLRYDFQWRRDRYVTAPGRRTAPVEFTAHAFEGRDLVVQWKSALAWSPKQKQRGSRPVTYFLLRKVAEGAFLMLPVTEDDVDEGHAQALLHQVAGSDLPHLHARAAVRVRARGGREGRPRRRHCGRRLAGKGTVIKRRQSCADRLSTSGSPPP